MPNPTRNSAPWCALALLATCLAGTSHVAAAWPPVRPTTGTPPSIVVSPTQARIGCTFRMRDLENAVIDLSDAHESDDVERYREVNAQLLSSMECAVDEARSRREETLRDAPARERESLSQTLRAGTDVGVLDMFPSESKRSPSRKRRDTVARCDELMRLGGLCATLQNDIAGDNRDAMGEHLALAQRFLEILRAEAKASKR